MKTKLTLFVAVIAAALFGVGCASVSQRPLGMPPKGHALSCKNGGGVVVKGSVDLIGDKDISIAFFAIRMKEKKSV